jgi:DUF1365 family protein
MADRGMICEEQARPGGSAILDARITHVRHAERRYALAHRQWYLAVDLDDLDRLRGPWLGYNRLALVSLRDSDYGDRNTPLRDWIGNALRQGGVELPGGRITLLTMPRVAGVAFNPVSFWLCRDPQGRLRAVLAEVSNTFGERHCYVCVRPDGGVIESGSALTSRKVFYVSPFLEVEGEYRFRFHDSDGRIGVFINLTRNGKPVLFAAIAGSTVPLTTAALLARVVRQPLPAMRVLMLIHIHAARLWRRGLKLVPRPVRASPAVTISPGPAAITPE